MQRIDQLHLDALLETLNIFASLEAGDKLWLTFGGGCTVDKVKTRWRKISRLLTWQSGAGCVNYIKRVLNRSFEWVTLLGERIREETGGHPLPEHPPPPSLNQSYLRRLIRHLRKVHEGLTMLGVTYADDPQVTAQLEVQKGNIDAQLLRYPSDLGD